MSADTAHAACKFQSLPGLLRALFFFQFARGPQFSKADLMCIPQLQDIKRHASRQGMGRHMLCAESDIAPQGMRKFTVGGIDVLLVSSGGRHYAVDDTCTHSGASLAEGALSDSKDGCTVTCGWHKAEFDCITGKLAKFPAPIRDLGSYKVTSESGNIFVEI